MKNEDRRCNKMKFPFKLPLLIDTLAAVDPGDTSTENWILEHPESFASYLKNSVESGADAVCAPTFRLNLARCTEPVSEDELESLNKKLVKITREASGGAAVGGMLGPTGLAVPPDGKSDFDDIYAAYRGQICALAEAGADFLFLNRQKSLSDMRAALLAARSTGLPVFACVSIGENGQTANGGSFLPILLTLQAMGAVAVGIGGPLSSGIFSQTIRDALPHASVPLLFLADADSGGIGQAAPILEAGARIAAVGLGFGDGRIREWKNAVKKYGPSKIPEEPDCCAAATETEAFFLGDDILFSDPMRCSPSLVDELIDLDNKEVSVALITINSVDDAVWLGRHGTVARLPIAVHADSFSVLEAALRYFQGRLVIDSNCQIERERLELLAAKYGAIIY